MLHAAKRGKIALVQFPNIQPAQVIAYDRKTMSNLPLHYIDPETGIIALRFNINYSDATPLYFVRSWIFNNYYYPVRPDLCRCSEWQNIGYCDHVRMVEEFQDNHSARRSA